MRSSAIAVLLLAVVASAALVVVATRHGVGITYDALNYIEAARSLAAGDGYVVPVTRDAGTTHKPLTWWPPGYPVTLAAAAVVTGHDAAVVARPVGVGLHGALLVAVAWAVRGVTPPTDGHRSWWPAAAAVALVATSQPVVACAATAWSETQFTLLSVACLGLVVRQTGTISPATAAFVGVTAGLAYLTRYAGVATVAYAAAAVFVMTRGDVRRRIMPALLTGVVGGTAVALMALRNRLAGDAALGREPLDLSREWLASRSRSLTGQFGDTVTDTLLPVGRGLVDAPAAGTLLLVAVAAGAGLLFAGQRRPADAMPRAAATAGTLFCGYGFVLVTLTFVAALLFDPATPLDWRLLMPPYVAFVIGVILLATAVLDLIARRNVIAARCATALAAGLCVTAVGVNARVTLWDVQERHRLEQARQPRRAAFACVAWTLDTLPPGAFVVANRRAHETLRARRPIYVDTPPFDEADAVTLARYRQRLVNTRGAVLWFSRWHDAGTMKPVALAERLDLVPVTGPGFRMAVLVPRETAHLYPPVAN